MGNNKWVHIAFAAAGILAIFLLKQTIDWVWGYFTKPNDLYVSGLAVLVGIPATVLAWRNERLFGKVSEVVMELLKVTWPPRKESYAATVVVIVTVIIFSLFLGLFDFIWSAATNQIYS